MAKGDVSYKEEVDPHGFPVNAPITKGQAPEQVVPWRWGVKQPIQSQKLKASSVYFAPINGNDMFVVTKTGAIINGIVTLNQETIFNNLIRGIYPEIYYELIDASYYTGNDSFEDIGPGAGQAMKTQITTAEINTNVFDLYFEAVASGDTGSSCQVQLYNKTGAAAVTGTALTTVATTSGPPERLRSGIITLPAGTNTYVAQYRRTPTGGFPRTYGARLVFRLKNL